MAASVPSATPLASPQASSGARLVSADGRELVFQGLAIQARACGGIARVVLRQAFHNPFDEALRVVYQLPLPADAAVAGYAFELDDRRILGEIDTRAQARERFEQALIEGRSAALLEEERGSLFTQELGNVPPRGRVVCELQLDQRLDWRPEGAWQWRFPTVVAPRYLGTEARVPDAEAVSVEVLDGDCPARGRLRLRIADVLTGVPTSPSHALHVAPDGEIGLAAEAGVALDRDLVLRWPVAAAAPGASLHLARAAADRRIADRSFGLLTLVPPTRAPQAVCRDLVVLLDTSGSMGGAPLAQAQAVTLALIDSLGAADSLELIEFSSRPRRWREGSAGGTVAATEAHKAEARAWVRALRAGGATEMRDGILEALATVRSEAQRQVILITDGLIGFEKEIVQAVAQGLPRGSRVHTLGIGSSVNRSLTGPVARAGGGIEAIVGLSEDPKAAAADLVARTAGPQIVDLELSGEALLGSAHHRLPDLFAEAPARLSLALRPEGGALWIRGQGPAGPWQQRLQVPPCAPGEGNPAILTLHGREQVEELELAQARGEGSVDARIEATGLDFRISTRCTSWVAVSEERTVDPGKPGRRVKVPQALPEGMGIDGLGLRAPAPQFAGAGMPPGAPMPMMVSADASAPAPSARASRILDRVFVARSEAKEKKAEASRSTPGPLAGRVSSLYGHTGLLLRGRLVFRKGDRVVFEIELDQDLRWDPGQELTLRMNEGGTQPLRLDATASTAPGNLRAGQTLRLVCTGLSLARAVGKGDGLSLLNDGQAVVVLL